MLPYFTREHPPPAIPISLVAKKEINGWIKKQPNRLHAWLRSSAFNAKTDRLGMYYDQGGSLTRVILILDQSPDIWSLADLPGSLPKNTYFIDALFIYCTYH